MPNFSLAFYFLISQHKNIYKCVLFPARVLTMEEFCSFSNVMFAIPSKVLIFFNRRYGPVRM